MSRDEIIAEALRIAGGQPGGTLATTHAEDGTPYVTFVLFHLTGACEVLFGSAEAPQHVRNLMATPEASFLIDNRDVIQSDWQAFTRVVIEGRAERVERDSGEYARLAEELAAKSRMAGYFTERGSLYRLVPRRLVMMRGLEASRLIVDFGR